MLIRILELGREPRQMDVKIPNCYQWTEVHAIKEYVLAQYPGWRFDRILEY